jgi:hypothetical protein
MAYNPERFVGPELLTQLATVPLVVFENKAIIKNITVSNILNGIVKYSIFIAPSGQDAQNYNLLFPEISLREKSIDSQNVTIVVNPGDKIYASASIPGGIVLTISGVEVVE